MNFRIILNAITCSSYMHILHTLFKAKHLPSKSFNLASRISL